MGGRFAVRAAISGMTMSMSVAFGVASGLRG